MAASSDAQFRPELDERSMSQTRPIDAGAGDVPFREAMRHLAGAANVVTVAHRHERTGLLAISVASFSVEPPTIMLGMERRSSTWSLLQQAGRFCVNTLADDQAAVADRFSGRTGAKGAARYDDAEWTALVTGAPALVGALATVDCDVDDAIERQSHMLVFGRVRAVRWRHDARPLLYWRGAFQQLARESMPAD
jgi:flavin reductase (DIM6/NTAB) family NADH-FMN oxidoreductase RutF